MMRTRGSQCGLTLVECLVSIAILGLGLVAVSGALTAALLSNQKAAQIELATAVAQDTLEEMRSRGFGSVTYDEFPTVEAVTGLHGGTRRVEIEDAYRGDARLKRAAVTVTWRAANGAAASVRLETVISNRGGHTPG